MDSRNLLIGLLVVGVGVLGYLYYDSQQTKLKINAPGVNIEAK